MNIHVAIPALNEFETLPLTINCLQRQTIPFKLYVCVNQKESWWNEPHYRICCENNQKTLEYLHHIQDMDITILDYSSRQKGWNDKNYGVGMARKVLNDYIINHADENDIMVSLDADTVFTEHYLKALLKTFQSTYLKALSVPYYHQLTGKEAEDRAILRYEIYMRNYALNMYHIASPYCYTAIGSAMACTVKNYKAIGGITPLQSGEDFYFMQKMAKFGRICNWNEECVYPQARFSNRVCFGTGPAMIKGSQGNWTSYPIYHYSIYNFIAQTYRIIPILYKQDVDNEFIDFLRNQFKTNDLWEKLRQNFKTLELFTKAFHQKVDALRLFQFLKEKQKQIFLSDETCLIENITYIYGFDFQKFSFQTSPIEYLDEIRRFLFDQEMKERKKEYEKFMD